MSLGKSLEKLGKYFKRLEAGKTKKIKPSHVRKVIDSLESRERDLMAEIAATRKPSKIERLKDKHAATLEHLEKARWLLNEIGQ